jgi:hypothetical protein
MTATAKPPTIRRINNTGICLAESSENGTVAAICQYSGEDEKLTEAHLYMVSMKLRCFDDEGWEKRPLTAVVYCLAPDEAGAIAQTEGVFWPHLNYVPNMERKNLSASAIQVPFMIRGWGGHDF